ncbi:hypothetical protein [Bacillus thuringiensis]|uniref:hypothetical protein n=1 Tax=Bacillus thuringiensis TaxID=1428 RepID=UPI000BFCF2D4|nr:hypothetical protein [Bacillus thuringiensis]PGT90123.1 hypothetical protein COD17_10260 [Bacillus thuringiensis]
MGMLRDGIFEGVMNGFAKNLPARQLLCWANEELEKEAEKPNGFKIVVNMVTVIVARHPIGLLKIMKQDDKVHIAEENMQILDKGLCLFLVKSEGTKKLRVGAMGGVDYLILEDNIENFNLEFAEDKEQKINEGLDVALQQNYYNWFEKLPLKWLKKELGKKVHPVKTVTVKQETPASAEVFVTFMGESGERVDKTIPVTKRPSEAFLEGFMEEQGYTKVVVKESGIQVATMELEEPVKHVS